MVDVTSPSQAPESVNYHFTRQCNYKCGFCFHTAKTSFVLSTDEAKRGLRMLKDAGMQKINFSGGEPFLHKRGKFLGELVKFCKEQLSMPSVSIISNGSLITEKWMQEFGEFVDIMGISCDSFNEEVISFHLSFPISFRINTVCFKNQGSTLTQTFPDIIPFATVSDVE